jgi:ABC-type multidrug transport system permease subunit
VTSLAVIIAKDLRLLVRDRTALVFITIAPIVVISVAGFSLASLYGADPSGQTAYELPIVDEDGGEVARQIEDRLAGATNVRVVHVGSRAEAERLVRDKLAGSALVIPAGTGAALAAGESARVLLYTDPVKYLERLNVLLEVLHARDELADEQRARAVEVLNDQRSRLREELERLDATLTHVREEIQTARRSEQEVRERTADALDAEAARVRADVARQLDERMKALAAQVDEAIATRMETLAAPARTYLDSLAETRRQFDMWFAELQRLATRRADEIPPPPSFPEPPPELLRMLDERPAPIELPTQLEIRIDLRRTALPDAFAVAKPVDVQAPAIEVGEASLPGVALTIEEVSVSGGPTRINTFDQNVPGFSVTFLLLGMLLGVSLGLLDERDWGTFERVRSLPVPARNILIGKLAARFAVGFVQMLVLFAVGYVLFGISLGPQPWGLLLPIVGIVFAGTTFGLIIAGLARSRDAVLPLGSIVIVTMAAVGGCWWPIDLEPRWMRTVALAFPTTWAMDAFNDLMIRWRPAGAAYTPTVVLLAYGMGYLAIGLALFRRRIAKGSW